MYFKLLNIIFIILYILDLIVNVIVYNLYYDVMLKDLLVCKLDVDVI